MRTGLHEGLMEQAVAKSLQCTLSKGAACQPWFWETSAKSQQTLKTKGVEGLETVVFSVFRPVQVDACPNRRHQSQEALAEQGGESAFEYKYDGARVQIHKQNGKVRVFSRRLTDVTESLPEIVETVKQNIKADSASWKAKSSLWTLLGSLLRFNI